MKFQSVEEGLNNFCGMWTKLGLALAGRGGEGRITIVNKKINCKVVGGPCYALSIGPSEATVSAGEDAWAHATATMAEEDWLKVLGGEYSIWSVALAGRQAASIEQQQLISQLGFLMQSFSLMA